jgi:hypothetical protein
MIIKVCSAAVGVSGDICRALGSKSLPYSDDIMALLLQNLGVRIEFYISWSVYLCIVLKIILMFVRFIRTLVSSDL